MSKLTSDRVYKFPQQNFIMYLKIHIASMGVNFVYLFEKTKTFCGENLSTERF